MWQRSLPAEEQVQHVHGSQDAWGGRFCDDEDEQEEGLDQPDEEPVHTAWAAPGIPSPKRRKLVKISEVSLWALSSPVLHQASTLLKRGAPVFLCMCYSQSTCLNPGYSKLAKLPCPNLP